MKQGKEMKWMRKKRIKENRVKKEKQREIKCW